MQINREIFRQYDIRGVVGSDVTPEVAEAIGRAFGTLLRRKLGGEGLRVALGRDNRLSSDELAAAVSRGLVSTGVRVSDVGTVPTPALYFAAAHLGTEGALQVTGSHNPPQYNGFKLSFGTASLYGGAIQELRELIEARDFEAGEGSAEPVEILPTYVREITSRLAVSRPLKVVADCGNGTGSVIAVELLRALGPEKVEVIPLFCESDGTFPNHHPDPVVDKNLQDLIAEVQRTGADLGVAFDGDADRIGAVDDRGRIVRGDTLLLLYGLDMLERNPGEKVVFDVKCSQALTEALEAAGGVPIMSKTGHSLMKERMKKEKALLAGELSGHIMFGENYYGFDDALYAAGLLLAIVSRLQGPLSERLDALPQFVSTAEIRYHTTEQAKFGIVDRTLEHFRSTHEVIDVDGARVLFGDGWGLLRASNTEPVLVARYEARSPERLAEIRETMEGWLRTLDVATS